MPVIHHVNPRNGDVLLLVGTMKGAFIFRANRKRGKWDMGGPYFPGSAVYAMAYDGRGNRHRIWAGPQSMHWGALLRSSDDFGESWTDPEVANVKFPEGTEAALKNIWQITPGRETERNTLYCRLDAAVERAGSPFQVDRFRQIVGVGRRSLEPSAEAEMAAWWRWDVPAHDPSGSD